MDSIQPTIDLGWAMARKDVAGGLMLVTPQNETEVGHVTPAQSIYIGGKDVRRLKAFLAEHWKEASDAESP